MNEKVSIEVNGLKFDYFTQISATRGYSKAPSEFSFTATTSPDDLTTFPILVGDICRVLVGDQPFISGFVQSVDVSHSASDHSINIKGSSFIVDLIESTMDNDYVFAGPLGFVELIQAIVKKAGLNINVIEGEVLNDLDPVWVSEETAGTFGDSIWAYMCKQAAKRNVLITENGFGDILLTRGPSEELDYSFIKTVNGNNNNLLSSSLSVAHQERFHRYVVRGQAQGSQIGKILASDPDSQAVSSVEQVGETFDDGIRRSRTMAKVSDSETEAADLQGKADWLANMALTNCFNYSCTHRGFLTDRGVLMEPGQSVYVQDEYSMMNAELIIDEVGIDYSSSGSIGTYKLLPIGAYTRETVPPKVADSGQSIGAILTRETEEEKTDND